MKKITYLVYLMMSFSFSQTIDIIDFKVTEPANQSFSSGERFNFEFKIKGDYNTRWLPSYHKVDLYLYYQSVSSSNRIGRIYWDREGDQDLSFDTYTLQQKWITSLRSYSTTPGKVFKMVVVYDGVTETYTYTYPLPDLSINLDGSVVNSDCFNCDNVFSQIGSDRHYLNEPSGIASIDLYVQNTGDGNSSSGTVGYYVSADNTFQSGSDTLIKSTNFTSISSNSGKYVSTALFVSDFNSFGGNFWLLVRVDNNNNNEESNENNNVFPLRFGIY